jgi:DNA gyrase/topoisomerase IV subunit A
MTMFNPRGRVERDPEDWGVEALKDTRNGSLQYVVILGVLGSVAIVPFAGVPMGIFTFACCLIYSFKQANTSEEKQTAIHEFGCVAHALEGAKFRAFRAQVQDPEVIKQLRWARDNNYPLSKDAAEFLDSQPTTTNQTIEVETQPMLKNAEEAQMEISPGTQYVPIIDRLSDIVHTNASDRIQRRENMSNQVPDLIKSIAENLKNTLIVGVPGVGKDLFLSNLLRSLRVTQPGATIFFIDPKNDPKESGYFEGCVDYPYRLNITEVSPEKVYSWVCESLEEFENFNAGTELKILCFGEIAATMKILGTVKGAAQLLKAKFVSYSSSGDSRGIKFIASSQNAHTDGIGFNGGERSIFTPIVLISAAQIPASEQILKAQIIPSDKRLSSYQLEFLCRKSPVSRAIYHGGLNEWFPMPELPNHSGYNRDTRSFVNQETALLAKLEASAETTITGFVANELGLSGEKAAAMETAIRKTLDECDRHSLIKKFNYQNV